MTVKGCSKSSVRILVKFTALCLLRQTMALETRKLLSALAADTGRYVSWVTQTQGQKSCGLTLTHKTLKRVFKPSQTHSESGKIKSVENDFISRMLCACRVVPVHMGALLYQYHLALSGEGPLLLWIFQLIEIIHLLSNSHPAILLSTSTSSRSTFTTKRMRQGRWGRREGWEMNRWAKLVLWPGHPSISLLNALMYAS